MKEQNEYSQDNNPVSVNALNYFELFTMSYYAPFMRDTIEMLNIFVHDILNGSNNEFIQTLEQRFQSSIKMKDLVLQFGKELFGSARWENETVIAENEFFALHYIPHQGEKQIAAVFMAGGYIPYSDSLFRFSSQRNFYSPFLKNGISVYEMKMKAPAYENNSLIKLSPDINISIIHEWADLAFRHNKNKKMILMGYCGTAIMAMGAYLADIEKMSSIFPVIATFAFPLDAKKCVAFSRIIELVSQEIENKAQEFYSGEQLSEFIDLSLERSHEKTDTGYFMLGWKNKDYYNVKTLDDLNERQKIELGMLYWLSAENSARTPISKELVDFMYRYFTEGVGKDGFLPFSYKGKPLDLKTLNNQDIQAFFFHGDIDNIVPPEAAFILDEILNKEKFARFIHKNTDHISYIFNMKRWEKNNEKGFEPNPLEVMLNAFNPYERY